MISQLGPRGVRLVKDGGSGLAPRLWVWREVVGVGRKDSGVRLIRPAVWDVRDGVDRDVLGGPWVLV